MAGCSESEKTPQGIREYIVFVVCLCLWLASCDVAERTLFEVVCCVNVVFVRSFLIVV